MKADTREQYISTAHTPGPWVVDTTGSGGCVVRPVVQQHKNQRICERATFNNARLIAAAPDMLEALRWAVNFLEDNYSETDMPELKTLRAARDMAVQS